MSASFYKNKLVNALRKLKIILETRMCSFWQHAMVQKMHLHANHLLNCFAIWSSDSPDKSNIWTRNRFGNRFRFLELNWYKWDTFELHSKLFETNCRNAFQLEIFKVHQKPFELVFTKRLTVVPDNSNMFIVEVQGSEEWSFLPVFILNMSKNSKIARPCPVLDPQI